MDEGGNHIADRLRSTRQAFGSQLRQLGSSAGQWRGYYERNPWIFVAAAFAGGLLLSAAIRRRRSWPALGHERGHVAAEEGTESDAHTKEVWERIKAALLTAAGSQISSFVREIVPHLLGPYRPLGRAGASDARSQNGSGMGGDKGRSADEAVYQ